MRERVSELMDCELDGRAAEHIVTEIEADASLQQAWNEFHLIGDAMRANANVAIDVQNRVSVRLRDEPTVLAPRRWPRSGRVRAAGAAALAASVGFAAVVAWQQLSTAPHLAMVVAGNTQPTRVAMLPAGGNADAYFLAHQELTANQGIVRVAFSRGAAH